MSYEEFYNLKQTPFGASPDERFYYDSPQHRRALIKLSHAAENMRGLAVLLGDIGMGKTTVARKLLSLLSEKEEFEVALFIVIHSQIEPFWLVKKIASQLQVDVKEASKDALLGALYDRLVELREEKKNTVVLIDEANMFTEKRVMEELRGLTNIEFPEGHLITFILFGLPELEEQLKLDKPLYERIGLKCQLNALDFDSAKGYIEHRLKVAGRDEPIFTEEAIVRIFRRSRGKPRLINTICDNALLEGYLMEKKMVDEEIVESVGSEMGIE